VASQEATTARVQRDASTTACHEETSMSSRRSAERDAADQPDARLAAALTARRDRAAVQLRRLEDEYAAALGDPGVIQEDADAARSMVDAARRTFEAAAAAVDQLAAGTYGRCASCGAPIGAERLEALPEATMCVTCQARS
jgi:DnaK suppressor protein